MNRYVSKSQEEQNQRIFDLIKIGIHDGYELRRTPVGQDITINLLVGDFTVKITAEEVSAEMWDYLINQTEIGKGT